MFSHEFPRFFSLPYEKKVVFFLLFCFFSPLISFFSSSVVVSCALCESSDHALCKTEGHDCDHGFMPSASCCSSQKPKINKKQSDTIGHKCTKKVVGTFLDEGIRCLLPNFSDLTVDDSSKPNLPKKSIDRNLILQSQIEHPPA